MIMRTARVLGSIGRFLIGSGIITLLFVAYQLWGTGLQHAAAQDDLAQDFATLLAESPVTLAEGVPDEVTATSEQIDTDPSTVEQPATRPENVADTANAVQTAAYTYWSDRDRLARLYPPNGDVLGRLTMPTIGIEELFVAGVEAPDLRKGPGHYGSTPLPGQAGNAAIAGHRTTYGAPFNRIDELQPGDELTVTTLQGEFTYRVMPQTSSDGETVGHFIVRPSATQVLDDFGDNRLTLTACHPKYSSRQRIVVVAELVGEPAITPPHDPGLASTSGGLGADEYASTSAAANPPIDDGTPTGASVAADDVVVPEASESEAVAIDGLTEGEIAAAPIANSFGNGLNGDSDAISPAVSWMIAALVLWFTAGFVGRRWKLLTTHAIFLVPFLVLLWMSFVHIDQALPAY
jgi:sortase A